METPQVIEVVQPKFMVMLGPRCPEDGFASDQEIVELPKAPHHSFVCIDDQSNTLVFLPPPKSHDPITHALEESYTASTLARCKLSLFLIFAYLSRLRECICLSLACSLSQHHGKSTGCMSCAFTFFFSMDAFKLRVCWSSLLYLSCF